jgi:hypothetical protein
MLCLTRIPVAKVEMARKLTQLIQEFSQEPLFVPTSLFKTHPYFSTLYTNFKTIRKIPGATI